MASFLEYVVGKDTVARLNDLFSRALANWKSNGLNRSYWGEHLCYRRAPCAFTSLIYNE